jgi:pimeloyl-ACP methyl ester carboxylesterase
MTPQPPEPVMDAPADYVLLHGGTQGPWVWDETLAALAQQTGGGFGRALALDIPGCGTKRGRDTKGFGPDAVADELMGDIRASGFRDIVLVGHSQAGTVLPRLVQRGADLIRRVVYVSCIAPMPGETALTWRQSMPPVEAPPVAWGQAAQSDLATLFRALFCNDMTEGEASAFLAKLGRDAWPDAMMQASDWTYDGLDAVPATYVHLLADATIAPAWQAIFAERFGARRHVRIDAGHQVMITRPQALAEALRAEARA